MREDDGYERPVEAQHVRNAEEREDEYRGWQHLRREDAESRQRSAGLETGDGIRAHRSDDDRDGDRDRGDENASADGGEQVRAQHLGPVGHCRREPDEAGLVEVGGGLETSENNPQQWQRNSDNRERQQNDARRVKSSEPFHRMFTRSSRRNSRTMTPMTMRRRMNAIALASARRK